MHAQGCVMHGRSPSSHHWVMVWFYMNKNRTSRKSCKPLECWRVFPSDTSGKQSACQCRIHETQFQSLGWEDSPRGGQGNPLQYSCLENPLDRGAWRTAVHRVIKSWTRLKWLGTHTERWRCALIYAKRPSAKTREHLMKSLCNNLLTLS